jgi:uncharacterized membrane protein (UPF0182 family)
VLSDRQEIHRRAKKILDLNRRTFARLVLKVVEGWATRGKRFAERSGFNYDCGMENGSFFNDDVVDITPRKRRNWWKWVIALVVLLFLFGSSLLSIYVDSLWFSSEGYAPVYWYKFRLGAVLFAIFFVLTFLLIRLPFFLLNRALPQLTERPNVRLASIQDIRDINLLPIIYRPGVWLLSGLIAFLSAANLSGEWSKFALYLNGTATGVADPVFNHDVSFYLFKLPVWDLLGGWFLAMSFVLFLAMSLLALYVNYIEKVRGVEAGKTNRQTVAVISVAGALLALAFAFNAYLNRYDILSKRHDLFSGANYTDVNVSLPGLTVIVVVLLLAAVLFLVNAFVIRKARLIVWSAAAIAATWIIAVGILPSSIYSFSVKPNELAKESPYIQHNINATRHGFGIDQFEERPLQPTPTITAQHIQNNRETLNNLRLWDRDALQSVLSQIQEIRTYYEFKIPDVDRYMVNGKLRQVLLAPREMNVNQLPEQSRNWINQHIVYTHGYGVAMATVNEFTAEGQPNLLLKNMPVESSAPELKITRPEIYFGESTDSHVYVNTKPQGGTQPEFNYPAEGNTDSYNEYDGTSGIAVGGLFRKLAMAFYLGDGTNVLFSDYVNADSRVLIRRDIEQRVKTIAPFLMFDDDPYIVISKDGRLYWMIDGFTYSERYPYSTTYKVAGQDINYIRNSVKAVVDAYDGSVRFYVFEPDDAIIKSYQNIFPSLFLPASEMPEDLRAHVRYPSLLVGLQANVYTLYHIQNPQTFYNHEDLWAIATEEVPNPQNKETAYMRPYHVLLQLPGTEQRLEFANILPFTPAGEGRNNMIGWLAARSDGNQYGHTLVYSFPKNITINGPTQIRARVNQDSQISSQMTLWSQKGSRLIRGSMLVIPLGDALLYVEPFYLQAESSPLPELRLVATATQDRLTAGKNFDEALNNLLPELASQKVSSGTVAENKPPPPGEKPTTTPPSTSPAADVAALARQAQQLISDYERLTAEGKHRDAGDKLDQLKQVLAELARKRAGQ